MPQEPNSGSPSRQSAVEKFLARSNLDELMQMLVSHISDDNVRERSATVRLLGLAALSTFKVKADADKSFNELFKKKIASVKASQLKSAERWPAVHQHTLERALSSTHSLRDRKLFAMIALWALHLEQTKPAIERRDAYIEALAVGEPIWLGIKNWVKSPKKSIVAATTETLKASRARAAMHDAMHKAMGAQDHNTRVVRDMFFAPGRTAAEIDDAVYYAAYRYSTKFGVIVKSFLAIIGPRTNKIGSFSFTHIYRDATLGDQPAQHSIERVTRGTIIGFAKSLYLIGAAGDAKTNINDGIKLLAIPREGFAHDRHLLTGVFLSNSRDWHPIVGRCALVRIGKRSELEREIDGQEVGAGYFENLETYRADFADMAKLFDLSKPIKARGADEVLTAIRNTTHVDLKQNRLKDGLLRSIAIETNGEPPD